MSLLKSIESSAAKVGLDVEQGLTFIFHLISELAPIAASVGVATGNPEVTVAAGVAKVAADEGSNIIEDLGQHQAPVSIVKDAAELTSTVSSAVGAQEIASDAAKVAAIVTTSSSNTIIP